MRPAASVAPTSTATASATASADVVGSWTRTQSCQEQLAELERRGLAKAEGYQWVTSNWVPGAPTPKGSDYCAGAINPIPHTHFFTADGQFGSRDENGQQVDDGDYTIASAGLLTFPSHAAEFGYKGPISVRYVVNGDEATFDVQMPRDCPKDPNCITAYGWALSAFFKGAPWRRS